jgi:Cobalamin-independent synthase, N-terminal domain
MSGGLAHLAKAVHAQGVRRDIRIIFITVYDHVLDAAVVMGAIPKRYQDDDEFSTYFAMARGDQRNGRDVAALEMTKWFDTNCHYIVPEMETAFSARVDARKALADVAEAGALGITTIPVLVGPLTFMMFARHPDVASRFAAIETITAAYGALLKQLGEAGISRVQLAEPCLVLDLDDAALAAYQRVYASLAEAAPGLPITLATYFGPLPEDSIAAVCALPIDTLHLDMTRRRQPMEDILRRLRANVSLSLSKEVRKARADFRAGRMEELAYQAFLRDARIGARGMSEGASSRLLLQHQCIHTSHSDFGALWIPSRRTLLHCLRTPLGVGIRRSATDDRRYRLGNDGIVRAITVRLTSFPGACRRTYRRDDRKTHMALRRRHNGSRICDVCRGRRSVLSRSR